MKIKLLLAALAAALAFTSCEDIKNEYHSTYFATSENAIVTYADQYVDSVHVVSYDTWSLENNTNWIKVYYKSQCNKIKVDVLPGYASVSRLDLTMEPNTTGKERQTILSAVSSYDKIGTVMMPLVQMPYLNITTPKVRKETNENKETEYKFKLELTQGGLTLDRTKPYMNFTVYGDGATLTSDQTWIKPARKADFPKFQTQKVELLVETNFTKKDRKANLTLMSNGIATTIEVTQRGL